MDEIYTLIIRESYFMIENHVFLLLAIDVLDNHFYCWAFIIIRYEKTVT